jgi:hypothetical protein
VRILWKAEIRDSGVALEEAAWLVACPCGNEKDHKERIWDEVLHIRNDVLHDRGDMNAQRERKKTSK